MKNEIAHKFWKLSKKIKKGNLSYLVCTTLFITPLHAKQQKGQKR